MVSLSSRRSSFVPTSITGVSGQWWLTSGYHWNGDDSDSNNTKTSSIIGHSWSASETPFKWRFAGGPIMGPILCCLCNKQKCLVVDKIMLVAYVVIMHTRYMDFFHGYCRLRISFDNLSGNMRDTCTVRVSNSLLPTHCRTGSSLARTNLSPFARCTLGLSRRIFIKNILCDHCLHDSGL